MNVYAIFLRRLNGQSQFRIFATLFSVMLAAFILAAIVSLGQGWMARNEKTDLSSAILSVTTADPTVSKNGKDSIYLSVRDSEFNELSIKEVGLHKTNPTSSLPLGITELPRDTELWVTPALKDLINKHPSLKQRYKDYVIRDTFPSEFAPSPDSLMVLYRINPDLVDDKNAQLKAVTTEELWDIYNAQKTQTNTQTTLSRTVLLAIGVILIVPLLLLVTEVSRIGITQREKKYAALSLVGATNAQLRILAALETIPLSLLGSILGVLLFSLVGVTILGRIPIGGSTFWETDLGLPLGAYIMICSVMILCSFIVSLQALRSVRVSPLTVTRTSNDVRRSSVLSLLPLLVGLGGIFALSKYGSSWYNDNLELGGIVLVSLLAVVIVGIFVSGQFITRLFSVFLIKCSRSASTTIAAHRLRLVARKIFHSISGVVLALFVGTILMTFLATMQATANKAQTDAEYTMVHLTNPLQRPLYVIVHVPQETSEEALRAIAGTEEFTSLVSAMYIQKKFIGTTVTEDGFVDPIEGNYYESCEQFLQRTIVECSTDIPFDTPFVAKLQLARSESSNNAVIQPQFIPTDTVKGTVYDGSYVLVAKDAASFGRVVNAAYTIASRLQMSTGIHLEVQYESSGTMTQADSIQTISAPIMAVITITILIGGLSIFVSVTGSVYERKRTFVRLRILGSDISTLVKALLIEIIVPLIGLSIVVVGLGVFCCYYLLATGDGLSNAQLSFSMPGVVFWIGLCAAIVLCTVVSLINVPLLNRLASFDDMRSE